MNAHPGDHAFQGRKSLLLLGFAVVSVIGLVASCTLDDSTGSGADGIARPGARAASTRPPAPSTAPQPSAPLPPATLRPGTYVSGVDVGGRTRVAAKDLLRAALEPRLVTPIPISAGEVKSRVIPAESGLSIDYVKTVEALADSAPPPGTASSSSGRTDHEPALAIDEAALAASVASFAMTVDTPAREGSIRLVRAKPVVINPQTGRALDRPAAVSLLRQRFTQLSAKAVDVPVMKIDVLTSQDDITRAMAVIQPALSGPIRMTTGGKAFVVPVSAVASAISLKTDPTGAITLVVEERKMSALLLPQLKPLGRPAKEARIQVVKGVVKIAPSSNGRMADTKSLVKMISAALVRPAPREVPVTFVTVEPRLPTAKARALGVKVVVSTFTTEYPCCLPRVKNIHTIAKIVDGALVLPGETFSLNKFVGVRDARRGFVEAPMILDGTLVPAVGGGVSQFATTMFNAVFFGGYEDVYHQPHSFYIGRYPAGREATVSSPAPDLKWKNDSPYGVLVKTATTPTSITVTFYGTKRFDEIRAVDSPRTDPTEPAQIYLEPGPKCIATKVGVPGFDIVVHREFYKAGKQVRKRERFYTRYEPEHIMTCGPDPAGATSG